MEPDEKPTPKPLVLGVDYYLEKGRWVFTEKFLRERGHCCESGCRHCPFGYRSGEVKRKN